MNEEIKPVTKSRDVLDVGFGIIRQLAERYATPLPLLTDEVAALAARVDGHLQKMGAVWK